MSIAMSNDARLLSVRASAGKSSSASITFGSTSRRRARHVSLRSKSVVPRPIRESASAVRTPTTPPPTTATRSPRVGSASHTMFTAVSALARSVAREVGSVTGTALRKSPAFPVWISPCGFSANTRSFLPGSRDALDHLSPTHAYPYRQG